MSADIEQIKHLPEKFFLASGFDTCRVLISLPELLINIDRYFPLLWLAGRRTEKDGVGYHLESYGYNLKFFNRSTHLN